MKYLLIDGNNLAVRCAFANEALATSDGTPTGVHFGFFQSLIGLKQKFPDRQTLIVWDGKSVRRIKESEEAVTKGVIPELYKANRKKEEMPKPLQDFYSQAQFLQRGIGQTGIPQIRYSEYEADDVIAAYCKHLKKENDANIIVVTSDRDYYQLLDNNVSLWDGMKQTLTTKDSWEKEYGINVSQYIDVGAFMGDDGDNIFGVPGWGEKTALKEIKKHGSWEKVIEAYEKEYAELKHKYADICKDSSLPDAQKIFDDFRVTKSDPDKETSRLKYPQISFNMPYTGVAIAFEKGLVKMPKTTLMALMFQERIKLAYSLKKMDDDIGELPLIENGETNIDKLNQYLEYYEIFTLQDGLEVFKTS